MLRFLWVLELLGLRRDGEADEGGFDERVYSLIWGIEEGGWEGEWGQWRRLVVLRDVERGSGEVEREGGRAEYLGREEGFGAKPF